MQQHLMALVDPEVLNDRFVVRQIMDHHNQQLSDVRVMSVLVATYSTCDLVISLELSKCTS